MTPDQREAHLKMLAKLPKRDHIVMQETSPLRNCGRRKRPVVIRGVRYESVTEAQKKLGIYHRKVKELFDIGEAEWA